MATPSIVPPLISAVVTVPRFAQVCDAAVHPEENVIAVPGVGQIEKVLQPKIGLLSHLRVLADRDEHGEEFSKQLRDQLAFKFPNVEITLNRYPEGLNDANEWLMKKILIAA